MPTLLPTLLLTSLTTAQGYLIAHGIRHQPLRARAAITMSDLSFISDETFEAEVIDRSKQGQPVLVDFTADWCGPCKLVEPLLADLDDQGAVKVVKAKPEHTSTFRTWLVEQGSKYGISGLPTIILFEKGAPAKVHMGSFDAKKLAAFVGDAAKQMVAPHPAPVPVPVRVDRSDAFPHM